jgi:hypothetical protein
MPLMRFRLIIFVVAGALGMLTGCAMNVPIEKIYGVYVVTYPYGTETLTLNTDGTFAQRVIIHDETQLTVRGQWEFDPNDSRVTLHRAIIVDDGFGHLRADWKKESSGLVALSVEMHWFRIIMGSGLSYPYLKQ